jgi:hypothetical protein
MASRQSEIGAAKLNSENNAMTPLFLATEKFTPSDGARWQSYIEWAKIPNLVEIVSLDAILCPRIGSELVGEDWNHVIQENFRLDYFRHLDYLLQRVAGVMRRNILGLYRNPASHIDTAPADGPFVFVGYDLIEEQTQVSALTNCGGFPDAFSNDELNDCGLISVFFRAQEVRNSLLEQNPQDPHAACEMYAVWRLTEGI